MDEIYKHYEYEFLKSFSKNDVHAIRGMLDEAYILNHELYSRNTFLNDTEIGMKDVKAHNLRAAIAKVAKLYCSKGIFPYKFATPLNLIRNCRHVELSFSQKTLYLARIEYSNSRPRKAQYRPIVRSRQENLFYPQETIEESVNVFLATYGDGGADEFKFGDIGILGEVNWLYSCPLKRGVYKYISKSEKEEILVELNESALREGEDYEKGEGR